MKIRYGMKSGQRQYVEGDESVELFEKLKADDQCLFAELISDDSRIVKRFTDENRKNETRNITPLGKEYHNSSFQCERCGLRIEDWFELDEECFTTDCHAFKFCPNCGKRVIE